MTRMNHHVVPGISLTPLPAPPRKGVPLGNEGSGPMFAKREKAAVPSVSVFGSSLLQALNNPKSKQKKG